MKFDSKIQNKLTRLQNVAMALNHPLRLKIINILISKDDIPRKYNVTQIIEMIGEKQPVVSRQLMLLYRARLVKKQRKGKEIYYEIDQEAIMNLIIYLSTLTS